MTALIAQENESGASACYLPLSNMRKLSRQEDLARFYANSEETREPSELDRSHTEVKKGSLNRKRAD
jgi:hypothetical protein